MLFHGIVFNKISVRYLLSIVNRLLPIHIKNVHFKAAFLPKFHPTTLISAAYTGGLSYYLLIAELTLQPYTGFRNVLFLLRKE